MKSTDWSCSGTVSCVIINVGDARVWCKTWAGLNEDYNIRLAIQSRGSEIRIYILKKNNDRL